VSISAKVVGGDGAAAVIGGEAVGDELRIFGLVMIRFVEADRAGLDRSPARLGHEGDDGRAVDAARKEGAERNVGDHSRADGAAR
jgi:hypothetical protein